MKLTQIDNACCIYEAQGFKLLCDPWLTDGAFEGSWMHYPPLATRVADVVNSDALYISHLHPDHYDPETLKHFRRDIPIVVLDHGHNFLITTLTKAGFTNLLKVKDKETVTLGPFEVTLYAPFAKHPFDDSELGNLLDSAMVVETAGKVVLNANDNTPTAQAALELFERHGRFDVAQLKDSLAGAFPSCFKNLNDKEKLEEAKWLINRQLQAMCWVAKELRAEWFQPFAGDYQLGGKLADKNPFLGVSSKRYSAETIAKAGIKPLLLNEGGSIDLVTGELKQPIRKDIEPYNHWLKRIKEIPYDYEKDEKPSLGHFHYDLIQARANLIKRIQKLNVDINYKIVIAHSGGWFFAFTLNKDVKEHEYYSAYGKDNLGPWDLICYMDDRILARILSRRGHWNSFEVGCHIDFERRGDYKPDAHTLMSFFHT